MIILHWDILTRFLHFHLRDREKELAVHIVRAMPYLVWLFFKFLLLLNETFPAI